MRRADPARLPRSHQVRVTASAARVRRAASREGEALQGGQSLSAKGTVPLFRAELAPTGAGRVGNGGPGRSVLLASPLQIASGTAPCAPTPAKGAPCPSGPFFVRGSVAAVASASRSPGDPRTTSATGGPAARSKRTARWRTPAFPPTPPGCSVPPRMPPRSPPPRRRRSPSARREPAPRPGAAVRRSPCMMPIGPRRKQILCG